MVLSSSGTGLPSAVDEAREVEEGLDWKKRGGKAKGRDVRLDLVVLVFVWFAADEEDEYLGGRGEDFVVGSRDGEDVGTESSVLTPGEVAGGAATGGSTTTTAPSPCPALPPPSSSIWETPCGMLYIYIHKTDRRNLVETESSITT